MIWGLKLIKISSSRVNNYFLVMGWKSCLIIRTICWNDITKNIEQLNCCFNLMQVWNKLFCIASSQCCNSSVKTENSSMQNKGENNKRIGRKTINYEISHAAMNIDHIVRDGIMFSIHQEFVTSILKLWSKTIDSCLWIVCRIVSYSNDNHVFVGHKQSIK